MLKIAGIATVGVILVLTVKKNEPAVGILLSFATVILLFFAVSEEVRGISGFLLQLTAESGMESDFYRIPLKALGLSVITQFAVNTAEDCGEKALAGQIEFAGRALILSTALPVLKAVLQVVSELVNGQ